jgi:hypothetical protein
MPDDARLITAPDEHPGLQRARLRAKTETAIERLTVVLDRLIAVLDDIDVPAEDLEPGGDEEPSLGWSVTGHSGSTDIPTLDCEQDDADREHLLGWGTGVDQTRLGYGSDDGEPELGSLDVPDQRRWADHKAKGWFAMDGEEECEDEGAYDDREPDTDDEGDAQATCIWLRDDEGRHIWPPKTTEAV